MKKKEDKLPFHRHFGLRLLQVLLIVFSLLLIKRCVDIYRENKLSDQQIIIEFYNKGFENGMNKSKGFSIDPEPQFKNYTLKKAYLDGYRQGWDKGREKEKKP